MVILCFCRSNPYGQIRQESWQQMARQSLVHYQLVELSWRSVNVCLDKICTKYEDNSVGSAILQLLHLPPDSSFQCLTFLCCCYAVGRSNTEELLYRSKAAMTDAVIYVLIF